MLQDMLSVCQLEVLCDGTQLDFSKLDQASAVRPTLELVQKAVGKGPTQTTPSGPLQQNPKTVLTATHLLISSLEGELNSIQKQSWMLSGVFSRWKGL